MDEFFLTYKKIELKEKIWNYVKLFLIGIFIEAFLIFILYIIVYSPLFDVKEIKITNLGELKENDVLNFIEIVIFGDSYIKKILTLKNILIWPNYMENNLNLFYPIKSLSFKKNYFNRQIEVLVNKRQEIGVWCLIKNNQCFWFDESGLFFKKTLASEGGIILKIYDYNSQDIGLGYKIDSFKIKIITKIFDFLRKNNIDILEVKLTNSNLEEIEVITKDGPKIYFSLRFLPPDINLLIQNLKDEGVFNKLRYLDLRVENKVYYQ